MKPAAPSPQEPSSGSKIPTPVSVQTTRASRKRPLAVDSQSPIVHSPPDEEPQYSSRRSRRRRLRTKGVVTNKSQQKNTTSELLSPNPDSAPGRKGSRARLSPFRLS